jgi:hypothetical protein
LALSFVKRIEHIRPGNKRGDHVEKIEGSGARFGAAVMRKKQRLFPDLGVWPLHAKHADSMKATTESTVEPEQLYAKAIEADPRVLLCLGLNSIINPSAVRAEF